MENEFDKSVKNFVKSLQGITSVDEDIKKLIKHLKKCIQLDAEIQMLIKLAKKMELPYKNEKVCPCVNFINLCSARRVNNNDGQYEVYIDNLGAYTFEYLEKESKKTFIKKPSRNEASEIYDEKTKETLKMYDVKYDELFKRVNKEKFDGVKDIDKLRLSEHKRKFLNEIYKLLELKDVYPRLKEYITIFHKKYDIEVTDDSGKKISKPNTTRFVSISSANIMSFLLYHKKKSRLPFHPFNADDILEASSSENLITNNKLIKEIRATIDDIMNFVNDDFLEKNLDDEKYHSVIYVDKVLFLAKMDYFFDWILFSSCFSDSKLYLNYKSGSYFNMEDIYEKFLLNSARYRKIETTFQNLFFTKWYILAMVKYSGIYNQNDFFNLFNNILNEYQNIIGKYDDKSIKKEDMISHLYQHKNILDKMLPTNIGKYEVNSFLLSRLSLSYCFFLINPVIRVKTFDEYFDMFS